MTTERHNLQHGQGRDEAEAHSQVERLFQAAVQLPQNERISWVKCQQDIDPGIAATVVAALQADILCAVDNDVDALDQGRAMAETVYAASPETQNSGPRPLPCIPNYTMIEEIARGGMGVVYRAQQHRPERIVAVKMMRMGTFSSPNDVQRFLNEANAASSLDHAAIVPVYEVGEIGGEPFITMKFINGATLDQLLERKEITTTDAICKLLVVAQAMADAHEHGIVHRDLKPSNILIERNSGQPWVTDFGLARNLKADSGLTTAGDIMGTPGYMAPEQALGKSGTVSPATDVYGLGAVLYRILTGRPPIQAETGDMARTIELIREHDVVAPRERDRRIPKELNTLCIKSLETDSTLRYQHARAFAEDLQRWLEGESIEAKPLGPIRRLLRSARHRPGLTATLSVLSVFSVYHVIANYAGLHPDSRELNTVVMVVVPVAVINAWFWQYWLRRSQGAAWTLYAWATGEAVLLTCVVIAGEGAASGLNPAYSLLVAASVLRCRPLLVGYVTVLTMTCCAVVWGYSVFAMRQDVDPLIAIPRLLALGLIGIIQYIALRKSSVSLESQVDRLSHSSSRNQK